MSLVEGCKHLLEISVPAEEVKAATERVTLDIQKRAKLRGFRPGKAPVNIVRSEFGDDIRQKVLESLVPKFAHQELENLGLHPVGQPDVKDVHFHDEHMEFKLEFEIEPEYELNEYKGLEVAYHDPEVTDEDVTARIEEIRNSKADYANVDPRALVDGDHAVVALRSVSGVDKEIKQDEMMLEIAGADTMPDFSENLRGMSPGEEKEFDVTYPEEYGQEQFAGKTIRFQAEVKGIRRKDLPEVNDEFAQDLGDYRTVDELRDAVRRNLFGQRQHDAQQEAKNTLVEKLVDTHEFPVPEIYVERQIRNRLEQSFSSLARQGVDISKLNLDWEKVKETQREKAVREVKASMLITKISEREAIAPTRDDVDREVERVAKQQREPVAAVRKRFEGDGTMGRIAAHIQNEKTMTFLFENARKVAE